MLSLTASYIAFDRSLYMIMRSNTVALRYMLECFEGSRETNTYPYTVFRMESGYFPLSGRSVV